ncbi:chromatin/chromatin-binding, or -regulatory protein [Lithospermum erythrorhizon]|uniref:MYB transcription factor n=1 Tax=Lithospermum erythrorhizon TaxID=34254 RepID=A0AAV3Q0X2_LITER
MGAPKQKWTAEEEAALRAGIAKYGLGKWSTILKDPDFSIILQSRSNVDLKDKWRNINVMVNGSGSRQRGKFSFKSTPQIKKNEENVADTRKAIESNIEIDDMKPLDEIPATPLLSAPKRPISRGTSVIALILLTVYIHNQENTDYVLVYGYRLDNVILEAINELKEPRGCSSAAISNYIEERYAAPSNIGELVEANLKHLTEFGRLVKVRNQYKLASSSTSSDIMENPIPLLLGGGKKDFSKPDNNVGRILTKSQVDTELETMRSMTVREAVAAAARAIVEAELAMAEAEKAAREAEEAEAEAETVKCFAEAAMRALRPRIQRAWVLKSEETRENASRTFDYEKTS